jgi:CheY-like chemotaxis protein
MDLKMPVLNGFKATEEIKQTHKNIPIIAQTAYALSGDREKAIEAGCDEYISKPIEKEELIKLIAKFL